MVTVRKIVLDVLKPHQPNALEFCGAIAKVGNGYRVRMTVLEMDENTETVQIEVLADAIDFETIQASITTMGGSIHSIDEVEVHGSSGKA